MNILVTAGNTLVPIDKVRCLTNIFTGRTGAGIAGHARERGHTVTLLTSHPESAAGLPPGSVRSYRTFEDLQELMAGTIRRGGLDAVIHSAAVSDYLAAGVYAPDPSTHFAPETETWQTSSPAPPRLTDVSVGKVKSDAPELWLRLVRAPKLIDRVRADWGFRGVLVKFKLEVGVSEEQLLAVAERSRTHSAADLMVANTLEGAAEWAYVGPLDGRYRRARRAELSAQLLDAIEHLHRERPHG